MISKYGLTALALVVFAAGGCMELGRRPAGYTLTIENPRQVGGTGLPVSSARPGGDSGMDYGEDAPLYRVSKTDTLSGIATRYYGDRRYTYDLYLVNGRLIEETGGLKRGMTLRLPDLEKPTAADVFPARP